MRASIRSNTGRPFRRAGREFPPQAIEVDLSDISEADRNAILGEPRLVVQVLSDDSAAAESETQRPGGDTQQGSAAATGPAGGAATAGRNRKRT